MSPQRLCRPLFWARRDDDSTQSFSKYSHWLKAHVVSATKVRIRDVRETTRPQKREVLTIWDDQHTVELMKGIREKKYSGILSQDCKSSPVISLSLKWLTGSHLCILAKNKRRGSGSEDCALRLIPMQNTQQSHHPHNLTHNRNTKPKVEISAKDSRSWQPTRCHFSGVHFSGLLLHHHPRVSPSNSAFYLACICSWEDGAVFRDSNWVSGRQCAPRNSTRKKSLKL